MPTQEPHKVFDYCFFCFRRNRGTVPKTHFYRSSTWITARFCKGNASGGSCKTYSPEDRKVMKWRWTELNDKVIENIDSGILNPVILCKVAGIPTIFSCDGHFVRDGYVAFYDEADAKRAMALPLADGVLQLVPKHHKILGTVYYVYIPKTSLTDVKVKPKKRKRN